MEGMMRLRKKYSAEFKAEAVKLAQQPGKVLITVESDLGIHDSLIRRWVKEAEGGVLNKTSTPQPSDLAKEVIRLKRENDSLRMERDIIKKALGYFAKFWNIGGCPGFCVNGIH
ncbi:transposase [Ferrovum sp. JA12]|nr:transposase [Ferrovum sp. JA12]